MSVIAMQKLIINYGKIVQENKSNSTPLHSSEVRMLRDSPT